MNKNPVNNQQKWYICYRLLLMFIIPLFTIEIKKHFYTFHDLLCKAKAEQNLVRNVPIISCQLALHVSRATWNTSTHNDQFSVLQMTYYNLCSQRRPLSPSFIEYMWSCAYEQGTKSQCHNSKICFNWCSMYVLMASK